MGIKKVKSTFWGLFSRSRPWGKILRSCVSLKRNRMVSQGSRAQSGRSHEGAVSGVPDSADPLGSFGV